MHTLGRYKCFLLIAVMSLHMISKYCVLRELPAGYHGWVKSRRRLLPEASVGEGTISKRVSWENSVRPSTSSVGFYSFMWVWVRRLEWERELPTLVDTVGGLWQRGRSNPDCEGRETLCSCFAYKLGKMCNLVQGLTLLKELLRLSVKPYNIFHLGQLPILPAFNFRIWWIWASLVSARWERRKRSNEEKQHRFVKLVARKFFCKPFFFIGVCQGGFDELHRF